MPIENNLYLRTTKDVEFLRDWLVSHGYTRRPGRNFPDRPAFIGDCHIAWVRPIGADTPTAEGCEEDAGFTPNLAIDMQIGRNEEHMPGYLNSLATIGQVCREIPCDLLWRNANYTPLGLFKGNELKLIRNNFYDEHLAALGMPHGYIKFEGYAEITE